MTSISTKLGATLTATEAKGLAERLAVGQTLHAAARFIAKERRAHITYLLRNATNDSSVLIEILHAVAGAKSEPTIIRPVWTLPNSAVEYGELTSSVGHLIKQARFSVVCSTYNFQRSSLLWRVLKEVSEADPPVEVRVYLDTQAADHNMSGRHYAVTSLDIAKHLPNAQIYRTIKLEGRYVRNHAKTIVIDEQITIVSSANFSISAERFNVELGLRVNDSYVATNVIDQLRGLHGSIYERVHY